MSPIILESPLVKLVDKALPHKSQQRQQLTKGARLMAIFSILKQLRPRFDTEAMWLLNVLFKLVEDRCTSAPFRSDGANHRERMYGPSRAQLRRRSVLGSGSWEFWARMHTIWIGLNGAVRISLRHSTYLPLVDVPGANGVMLPKKEG